MANNVTLKLGINDLRYSARIDHRCSGHSPYCVICLIFEFHLHKLLLAFTSFMSNALV